MTPEAFEQNREDLLNRWALRWYFDGLGHEVIYRPTSDGPEVIAVGSEETSALRRSTPPEEQLRLRRYLGH